MKKITKIWLICLLGILMMGSCKTKTMTEDHYITDKTIDKNVDKSLQERFIAAFEQMAHYSKQSHDTQVTETTHTKDSTSTTLDADGKPIKTEKWHSVVSSKDTKEVLRLQDSLSLVSKEVDKLNLLVVQRDSLIRLRQDSIHILNRELTKSEQRYMTLGKYAMGSIITLVIVIIGLAIWLWHRKQTAHEKDND